jgi:hypothetical protein
MAARCSPPKSQSVKSHTRSRPRRKYVPATYWECESHGKGCGTKHRTYSSSLGHAMRLDSAQRRQGRRPSWHPKKHG